MIQLTLEDMASALTLCYLKLSACELNTQICREKAQSAHVLWIEHGENAKNDLKRPQPGRDVQIHFQLTSIRINFLKEQVVKPFIERKESSRDEWMTIIIKLLFMFSPPCMFMFPIIWMRFFFSQAVRVLSIFGQVCFVYLIKPRQSFMHFNQHTMFQYIFSSLPCPCCSNPICVVSITDFGRLLWPTAPLGCRDPEGQDAHFSIFVHTKVCL